jgi:hypothetical protein
VTTHGDADQAKPERDGASFDRQWKEDYNLVKRIDEHGENLTDWEVEFVASAVEWIDCNKVLTDKMRKIAERIDEQRVR